LRRFRVRDVEHNIISPTQADISGLVVMPYFALCLSSLIYIWVSPDMLETHPQLVVLLIGTVHAYIVGRFLVTFKLLSSAQSINSERTQADSAKGMS